MVWVKTKSLSDFTFADIKHIKIGSIFHLIVAYIVLYFIVSYTISYGTAYLFPDFAGEVLRKVYGYVPNWEPSRVAETFRNSDMSSLFIGIAVFLTFCYKSGVDLDIIADEFYQWVETDMDDTSETGPESRDSTDKSKSDT